MEEEIVGAPTNETALVAQIVKAVKEQYPDAWILKVHGGPYQMPGVPDLLFCINGRFIGLEVKHQKPGESAEHAKGRTTARQRYHIRKINRAGGVAATVISPEEALRHIARALK